MVLDRTVPHGICIILACVRAQLTKTLHPNIMLDLICSVSCSAPPMHTHSCYCLFNMRVNTAGFTPSPFTRSLKCTYNTHTMRHDRAFREFLRFMQHTFGHFRSHDGHITSHSVFLLRVASLSAPEWCTSNTWAVNLCALANMCQRLREWSTGRDCDNRTHP